MRSAGEATVRPVAAGPGGRLLGLWSLHLLLPAVAAWSLAWALTPARPPVGAGGGALLGGVLAAYLGDRLRDRRLAWSPSWRRAGWLLAGSSGALAVALLLSVHGWSGLGLLLPPMVVVAGYPWLGRLPLVKNLAVAACWWWACSLLVTGDWASATQPAALFLALLVCIGAGLCDLKDAAIDRRRRIRSAVALWGLGPALALLVGLELTAAIWLLLADLSVGWWLPWAGLLLLTALPSWSARPLLGPVSVDAVLALAGPALALATAIQS